MKPYRRTSTLLLVGILAVIILTGSFSLQAQAASNVSNTLNSNVTVKLNYKSYDLIKGKTVKLKVEHLPKNYTVSYQSSDLKVATVNSSGTVKAVNSGSARINITIKSGKRIYRRLTCNVKVGVAAVSVVIPKSKLALQVGEKKALNVVTKPLSTVESPVYKSSNPQIASVNKDGVVIGKRKGTVTITATISNGKKDTCTISVQAAKKN